MTFAFIIPLLCGLSGDCVNPEQYMKDCIASADTQRYGYERVVSNCRALINLIINDNISLGRWINDALLFVDSKCARYGTCTLRYAA